jgi:hypothetical protein
MLIWISKGQRVRAADRVVLGVYFDSAKYPALVCVSCCHAGVRGMRKGKD